MRTLLSTTAIVLSLALPSLTQAQTARPAARPATQAQSADMPGFLGVRGQADILASELMGHDVHARRTPSDTSASVTKPGMPADGTRTMPTMSRADLEGMDNIGQINDLVLSSDGQVRAIVIGVGGFLGAGEQDVAVTLDHVTFATDPGDRAEMYIVVSTGADMLRASPRYERVSVTNGAAAGKDGAMGANRTAFIRPEVTRKGYNLVEMKQVSSEMLVGKSVYGVNDNSVGTVDDLIVDAAGTISEVIIDFGGFLGMGSSQVSMAFDELTILSNDGNADVRVYVDATKEQIQALPPYKAVN